MNNYTFLIKNPELSDPSDEVKYYAISPGKIETMRESKCYTSFGQQVGTYDAGDSIEIKSTKAAQIATQTAQAEDEDLYFPVGSIVSGYDNPNVFDEIEKAFDKEGLKDGEDYDLYAEEVKGFDFWDGHNFQTVTVEPGSGFASHIIIDDKALIAQLNAEIDSMVWLRNEPGCTIYQSAHYEITDSAWAGHWESYELTPLEA